MRASITRFDYIDGIFPLLWLIFLPNPAPFIVSIATAKQRLKVAERVVVLRHGGGGHNGLAEQSKQLAS